MEKTIKKPVEEKPTVGKADRRINAILSVVLGVLCVAWIYPIVMIFFNSLKTERAITTSRAFELPTAGTFVGLKNYIYGIQEMDFLSSFWYSLVITVSSVVLILLCCSMCAWFITRVNGKLSKLMYGLCMFSMVVPFQMVMFTLSKLADMLKLNTPWGLCFVYLGFGAGLAVFIFTGVVKGIPESLEESAMIDGANDFTIFTRIISPLCKPVYATVALFVAVGQWNSWFDAMLYNRMNTQYTTLQYELMKLLSSVMQQSGSATTGGNTATAVVTPVTVRSAATVVTMLPIILLYPFLQRYFVSGMTIGSVKE